MKLSKWNSYISLNEKYWLIFNSFTEQYILIRYEWEDFKHLKNGNINSISKKLFNNLIKIGGIIKDNIDEDIELENLIKNIDNQDSRFELIVNPTLECNFHCWYCYENHVKGSLMTTETINRLLIFIEKKLEELKNLKYFHLSFFGGEPLIAFDTVITPLINNINNIISNRKIEFSISFTTNSYLITDKMLNYLSSYNTLFQITLDGGKENHNKTRFPANKEPTFNHILNNIKKLTENKFHVTLRINYTNKNIDSTHEIIDIVDTFPPECKKYLYIDYQRVWQDEMSKELTNENIDIKLKKIRKYLKSKNINIKNHKFNNIVRNSCYGDKINEVLVNYNGDIYACTARDFTKETRYGYLNKNGSIIWENDSYLKRMNCKFIKKICKKCRIAPICGGGCRTKCMENLHHEDCNFGFNEEKINSMILERFEEKYIPDN